MSRTDSQLKRIIRASPEGPWNDLIGSPVTQVERVLNDVFGSIPGFHVERRFTESGVHHYKKLDRTRVILWIYPQKDWDADLQEWVLSSGPILG